MCDESHDYIISCDHPPTPGTHCLAPLRVPPVFHAMKTLDSRNVLLFYAQTPTVPKRTPARTPMDEVRSRSRGPRGRARALRSSRLARAVHTACRAAACRSRPQLHTLVSLHTRRRSGACSERGVH